MDGVFGLIAERERFRLTSVQRRLKTKCNVANAELIAVSDLMKCLCVVPDIIIIITDAGLAAGVGRAFSRISLSVYSRSNRKTA